MANIKPRILIICDYYLPGTESGGAMRTLVNMVERLGSEFDFRVVTRDHDRSSRVQYSGVRIDRWNEVENAKVFYLSRANLRASEIVRIIDKTKPDAIYLNSFFSPLTRMTLLARRRGKLGDIPVILAPEGEFCVGGLTLKPIRKSVYLSVARRLGLERGLLWKAASEMERDDIISIFGDRHRIVIAPNMPPVDAAVEVYEKPTKQPGSVRLVFLSRFMRKKNLNWFLRLSIEAEATLDIWGAIEARRYKDEADSIIANLPPNIHVTFKGEAPFADVPAILSKYHFFVLPTLGENFGHVVVEALAAGCPLIISDQTPWRALEAKNLGWDLSLNEPNVWLDVLRKVVEMNDDEFKSMSQAARKFAAEWLFRPELNRENIAVFQAALRGNATTAETVANANI